MSDTDVTGYRGRFAPSPTGPLHFGSLVAAVGSYLQARSRGGEWCVRIEDIDPPREVAGATDLILRALEAYGFEWDGAVLYQSRRNEYYRQALQQLAADGLIYACDCSRKEAAERAARQELPRGVYPGTCRRRRLSHKGRALRIITAGAEISFDDLLQGRQRQALEQEVGDFVVRRADGQYAYQLAVVVDDAAQDITEVVRGSDLLDSTARQIFLQRALGLPQPGYLHLPVAVDPHGEKLSKQTHAPPLDLAAPFPALSAAFAFLGLSLPAELHGAPPVELWPWAIAHWRPDTVTAVLSQAVPVHDG